MDLAKGSLLGFFQSLSDEWAYLKDIAFVPHLFIAHYAFDMVSLQYVHERWRGRDMNIVYGILCDCIVFPSRAEKRGIGGRKAA